jgi:hypothetical protein
VDRFTATRRSRPSARHAGALAQRLVEHPARQRLDEVRLLGERDEGVRAEQAEEGVLPAHERLGRVLALVAHGELGLVVQDELALLDRPPQLRGQAEAVEAGVVLPGVDLAARVLGLGAVEREVGVLHQRHRVVAVGGEHGEAEARADVEREGLELQRLLEAVDDRAGQRLAAARSAWGSRIANSSPPSRATVASGGTAADMRSATRRRYSSPSWWPRESLTALKSSRSASITTKRVVRAVGGVELLVEALAEELAVGQLGELVVEGAVLVDDRLAATEVDGQQRQRQERHEQHVGLRAGQQDGRQRELEAGGPGVEAEVAEDVGRQRAAGEDRRADPGEDVVDAEQRDAGHDHRRQLARDVHRVGLARPQLEDEAGHRDRDRVLGRVEDDLHRGRAVQGVGHGRRRGVQEHRRQRP